MALDQQSENVAELDQMESSTTGNASAEPVVTEPDPTESVSTEPTPSEAAPIEPAPPQDGGNTVLAANPERIGESTESYYEALKRLENEKENEKKKMKKKKRIIILSAFAVIVLLLTFSSIHKKNALTAVEKAKVKSLVSSIDSLPNKISENDESKIVELNKQYDSHPSNYIHFLYHNPIAQ